ncbi:MAG TPA: inositol-3-phosphate synthase, partial [bacterium]|nr:inositol-3-phosphate synthase [bacterium]
ADLAEGRIFDGRVLDALAADLAEIDRDIVRGGTRGVPPPCGAVETPAAVIEQLVADLRGFRRRHALERVVVVNLATTEPIFTTPEDHLTLAALEDSLTGRGAAVFRPSTLYAYAAMRDGAAFVNFAASPAALVPAIRELAEREGVPFAGTDGKTGETLVKSALASLFRERDLQVLSWHGQNLLGNADGAALSEPEVKAAKVESKDGVVRGVLGYSPATSVDITYVPSLGDWKTAWDLIHFQGFLGTRMTMQFTWQGCDSILAAPLVIDLVRLADLALRRGESGPMTQAACFFKAPVGTPEHDLGRQYAVLDRYLRRSRLSAVVGGKRASL